MNIGERFRRWQASRGFGVHSPLAFTLVKRVVRPPRNVIYYGEQRLEDMEAPPLATSHARLLLRLVAEIQPAYVWVYPNIPKLYLEAIKMAGGVVRIFDGEIFPDEISKSDMIVTNGVKLSRPLIRKLLKEGKTIVGFDLKRQVLERISSELQEGVLLDGVVSVIAVGKPGSQAHKYQLSKF